MSPSPRILGPLGEVGPLAFGHWRFVGHDLATARRLVESALDLGMNLIDTADIYGYRGDDAGFGDSEMLLGEVLRSAPGLRDRMVLATKGGIVPGVPYDSSQGYLTRACEASLRRLGTEVIDLYQIHRPDPFTHPAEVAEALNRLVESGKVRAIGVSNYPDPMIEALHPLVRVPFVTTQPEYSVGRLDPLRTGSLDQAMRLGLTPLAWSPLAGGRLATGQGIRSELIQALDRIAAGHGCDRSAVALAFVLAHPSAPVAIVGSQRVERLREATRALTVDLTRSDLYDLIEASEGVPLP
jgi:aryl-alcohol dehydrogenase-like predicted oxidoreductase